MESLKKFIKESLEELVNDKFEHIFGKKSFLEISKQPMEEYLEDFLMKS